MAHAQAYEDPGTPEEQTRRTFLANAVIALSGVMGLGLVIPLVTSLVPSATENADQWSALSPDQGAALQKATDATPIKVTFNLHETNGYFGASDTEQFVWAVKTSDAEMRQARPELYSSGPEKPAYPVVSLGFAIFSPICPHLGCRYAWNTASKMFLCPCHGSTYTSLGKHDAGPALRGLDPLPLRKFEGKVQVTWIEFQTNTPSMIIQKIG